MPGHAVMMPEGATRPRLSNFSLTISNSFVNRAPAVRLPIRRRMRKHTCSWLVNCQTDSLQASYNMKASCKRLTVGTSALFARGLRPCNAA
eukprot:364495-Chlamydomonas_euryale.AAC.10